MIIKVTAQIPKYQIITKASAPIVIVGLAASPVILSVEPQAILRLLAQWEGV